MNSQEETKIEIRTSTQDDRRAARRAAWFWGTLVVSFLAMQIGIGAVAVVLATNDPSVAVVPDYYQKALDWGKSLEAERISDSLGWTSIIEVGDPLNEAGQRFISVRMTDSHGNGLGGLDGSLRLFHHSRATEVDVVRLEFLGSGVYRGKSVMARDGLWEFELQFSGDEPAEQFIDTQTLHLELGVSTAGAAS